jgi:trigger factor
VDDRGVEDGDRVTIDFDGYVDGKRFDGGKSEDYPLVIGSHTFIDTFEEQLVGKLVGEECEVNVTFPEEYHVAELKSKPALFKVTVKEIQKKELPEVNDEFASEVSDFDTLEEYKKDLAEKLLKEKQTAAATANENKVVEKVVENATMEIPELMIDEQVNGMINNYARRIESQGISFKDYMEVTGMGIEKLAEQMRPAAIKNIETRLVLEAVVQAENLEASDEAIEEQFNKMAESYRMEKDEIKKMYEGERLEQMKQDLAVQEAIDFLVAEAKLAD